MTTKQLKACIMLATLFSTCTVMAAGVIYQDGDRFVELGGRIQLQYYWSDPDGGDTSDDLFFRRLRPYIKGSVHKDWVGKFEWDMGKASGDNELVIKDAYMEYGGIDNLTITVGNKTFPFSREQLTSSKAQQLVERTFVGDHDYGSADRQAGFYLDGASSSKNLNWSFAIANAAIDPDNRKLDFDSVINENSDFNAGWMLGGRLDFGGVKNSQANFKGEDKFGFAVAAFTWSNDDDNNIIDGDKTPVDNVAGIEISAAFRQGRFSVDGQYNTFDAELTMAPIVAATLAGDNAINGIYDANGKTTLEALAIEGGALLFNNKGEIVLGYQTLDADGYAKTWKRSSLGYNWYLHQHDIKLQFSYDINQNQDGVNSNDVSELFVQAQYVF